LEKVINYVDQDTSIKKKLIVALIPIRFSVDSFKFMKKWHFVNYSLCNNTVVTCTLYMHFNVHFACSASCVQNWVINTQHTSLIRPIFTSTAWHTYVFPIVCIFCAIFLYVYTCAYMLHIVCIPVSTCWTIKHVCLLSNLRKLRYVCILYYMRIYICTYIIPYVQVLTFLPSKSQALCEYFEELINCVKTLQIPQLV